MGQTDAGTSTLSDRARQGVCARAAKIMAINVHNSYFLLAPATSARKAKATSAEPTATGMATTDW